jgi:hypothetical protein
MHWYVFANLVLAALVVGAIVGLLVWALLTQHHDDKCEDVRLKRRRITARAAPRHTPRPDLSGAPIALRAHPEPGAQRGDAGGVQQLNRATR